MNTVRLGGLNLREQTRGKNWDAPRRELTGRSARRQGSSLGWYFIAARRTGTAPDAGIASGADV